MGSKAVEGWFKAGMNAWMLGVEAPMVVGQRWAMLAAGGSAAAREAELMISEKVRAGLELQLELATKPTTPLGGTK